MSLNAATLSPRAAKGDVRRLHLPESDTRQTAGGGESKDDALRQSIDRYSGVYLARRSSTQETFNTRIADRLGIIALATVLHSSASPCCYKAVGHSAPIKEAFMKVSSRRAFTLTGPPAFRSAPSTQPSLPAIPRRSESRSFGNSGNSSPRLIPIGRFRPRRQGDRSRATGTERDQSKPQTRKSTSQLNRR
jgi:hypothetical protein